MSWSGQPIHGTAGVSRAPRGGPPLKFGGGDNAARQRKAAARMSEVELATGRSPEWWSAWHAENRERVLRRYGVRP